MFLQKMWTSFRLTATLVGWQTVVQRVPSTSCPTERNNQPLLIPWTQTPNTEMVRETESFNDHLAKTNPLPSLQCGSHKCNYSFFREYGLKNRHTKSNENENCTQRPSDCPSRLIEQVSGIKRPSVRPCHRVQMTWRTPSRTKWKSCGTIVSDMPEMLTDQCGKCLACTGVGDTLHELERFRAQPSSGFKCDHNEAASVPGCQLSTCPFLLGSGTVHKTSLSRSKGTAPCSFHGQCDHQSLCPFEEGGLSSFLLYVCSVLMCGEQARSHCFRRGVGSPGITLLITTFRHTMCSRLSTKLL